MPHAAQCAPWAPDPAGDGLSSFPGIEEIIERAKSFIARQVVSASQAKLLTAILAGLHGRTPEDPWLPFIDIPLLVSEALGQNEKQAMPLVLSTTLLFLGVDTLDDLADGDQPFHWQGRRPSEINLAAATLLSSLPQIALAELDTTTERRAALQETLARGLLRMSEGQQQDLHMNSKSVVDPDQVEASLAAKSGEETAVFASLSATFAGAPPETVSLYRAMGKAVGTAGQLASDCHDLFNASRSKDLANGTRTLPIALYLEKKAGAERRQFLDLLDQRRRDPETLHKIRVLLHAAGILRMCAFIVEIYCQRALRALKQADPREPAGTQLRKMIRHVSFFQKGGVS